VEKYNPDTKRLTDVFVNFSGGGEYYQLTSNKAYEQKDEKTGARYLVLEDGYRYEGVPGQADYRVMHFREHGIRIQKREPILSTRHRYAYPTTRLLASSDPEDKAELQWRLATPISILLLGLLAVPLSKTSPRRGRFGGMVLGILIYLVYNNLLTVAKSSMGKGEVPEVVGMWWVHLLLLGLLLLLHWRQSRPVGLLRLRRGTK
jgi:lipopolysaccharide export system permease protein